MFMFDGEQLNKEKTVGEAELQDQDSIECVKEQVGGS